MQRQMIYILNVIIVTGEENESNKTAVSYFFYERSVYLFKQYSFVMRTLGNNNII